MSPSKGEGMSYLSHLFEFNIDGKALETAKKTYFDQNFEKCGIVFSGATPAIKIAVDELIHEGKFVNFLGATALELEKRRLLGSQFLAICRDHPEKLQGNGYHNFFVLTRNDKLVAEDISNVFVAYVYVRGDGELYARLAHVSFVTIWRGDYGHRVFSPQQ